MIYVTGKMLKRIICFALLIVLTFTNEFCIIPVQEARAETATEIIIDNTAAEFTGTWLTSTYWSNYYGTNYSYKTTGTGTANVRWRPDIATAGIYGVYYYLPNGYSDRPTNASYTVYYNEGSTSYTVDQTVSTGGQWVLLGQHEFAAGTSGYVELTDNCGGKYINADAVKFVLVTPAAETKIVDNTEAEFTGTWTTSTYSSNYYGSNYCYNGAGTGTEKIVWRPNLTAAGDYVIYYWLPDGSSNRPSNATYRVYYNGGSTSYQVDETSNTSGQWVYLGVHNFAAGTIGYVELTDSFTGTYINADAVKFEPYTGQQPPITVSTSVRVNMIGYKPEQEKTVIVADTSATSFDVINASTGAIVLSGCALSGKNDPISGNVMVGDFSQLTTEGTYRIVTSNGKYSAKFDIKENLYEEVSKLALRNMYYTRFSSDRKAYRQDTNGYVQVGSGWEDAWDGRHWSGYSDTISPWALSNLLLDSSYNWDGDTGVHLTNQVNDIAEELKWGLEYLFNIQERNPSGSGWMKFGQVFSAWAPPENGNIISIDEPDAADLGAHYNKRNQHVLTHYLYVSSMANSAMYFNSIGDTDYAAKCADYATAAWNYIDSYDETSNVKYAEATIYTEYFRAFPVMNYAYKVIAAISMYELTGNTSYKTKAETYANKIVDSQYLSHNWNDENITGYMMKEEDSGRVFRNRIYEAAPYYALAQMVEKFKTSDDWFNWYSSLKIFSDSYVKKISQLSAYEIMPYGFEVGTRTLDSNSTKTFRYFHPNDGGQNDGNTKMLGLYAAALSNCSMALNDLKLENIALDQLNWLFGLNPFSMPVMAGVGERQLDDSHYYNHHGYTLDTVKAPGAVVNGIAGDANDNAYWNNSWQTGESWGINREHLQLSIATLGQKGTINAQILSYSNSSYEIRNRKTNEVVKSGLTDANGNISAELNGGGEYTLIVGNYQKDFDLPSGKKLNLTIDRNDSVIINSITATEQVDPNSQFDAVVEIKNNGLSTQTFSIELKGSNLTGASTKTIQLAAGQTGTLTWTLTAGETDKPYVILAIPGTDKENSKGLLGYVN